MWIFLNSRTSVGYHPTQEGEYQAPEADNAKTCKFGPFFYYMRGLFLLSSIKLSVRTRCTTYVVRLVIDGYKESNLLAVNLFKMLALGWGDGGGQRSGAGENIGTLKVYLSGNLRL